jgi:flagellar protein FlbT
MPLRIKLPAKEKIIINGAVIENAGEATTIVLHNRVDILRRKEVMAEKDAVTPARRVYYTLQCAYLFEEERERYLKLFAQFAADYAEAAPSAGPILKAVQANVATEQFYDALRETQKLIAHENERLEAVGGLLGAAKPD